MAETVRADARRNRERIIAAASACFADEGMECQISAIAKHAGVGSATVFRHFPAKHDLHMAVMHQRIAETQALVAQAAADEDATAGLRAMLVEFVGGMVSDRGLKQAALGEGFQPGADLIAMRDAMFGLVQDTLERAQAQGGVRADVELADLIVLTQGVAHAAGPLEPTAPGSWRRHLALALRGVFTAEDALPDAALAPAAALEPH